MPFFLSSTKPLKCTMGLVPAPLTAIGTIVCSNFPFVTIDMGVPMMNITPFGMCRNPANPEVAAIIASSLGTVTIGPCIPLPTPWISTTPNVIISGMPSVCDNAMKMCYPGGIIQPISVPGTVKS